MIKRFLNYTLALVLVGYMVPIMPMNNGARNPWDAMVNQFADPAHQAQMRAQVERLEARMRQEQQREDLERQRLRRDALAGDEVAREELRGNLRRQEQWDGIEANFVGGLANVYLQAAGAGVRMMENEQQAGHRLQEEVGKAAVNAKANKEASAANLKQKLDWVKEPKNLATIAGGVGLTVFAGYGAYQGLLLLSEYIRHLYRNPTLAKETSLLSLSEKINQFIFGKKIEPKKITDAILTPELEEQIRIIESALKKAAETDDFLFNILLWGPPGTGKTLIGTRLARSCGIHYTVFAASDLDQYTLEEAMIKLREEFDCAKNKGIKLVIVIDEIERLLPNRNNGLSERTGKILTEVLSYTGTETNEFMIIGMTNRPQDIDEAFVSRCDYNLYIGAPDQTQRARIIKKYMTDYLLTTPAATYQPTVFGKIANIMIKPKPKPRIAVAPDAVNDATIQEIARLTDGFVGRDLSKMIAEMRRCAQVAPNRTLTKAMVNEVVARKCKERVQQAGGFKREEVQVRTTSKPAATSVAAVPTAVPVKGKQTSKSRRS